MTTDPTLPTETAGSKTKTFAIGGGLLAAGIVAGAMFAPIGLAGAQESDDETAPGNTASDDAPFRGERHGRGHHHWPDVLEELGLTTDQIRAGIEADQSLLEIAEANGITEAELVAALEAEADEHLAEAVESGRLTQEEADERAAVIDERIAEGITTLPSERQERRQDRREDRLEPLTDLGLTVEDLVAGRQAGQTLAETAEANGISEAELVDALVAAAIERADEAVEAGRITQEQADERLADIEEHITDRVNSEPRERDGRGHGPGSEGPRGQRDGFRGGGGADVEESSLTS